MSYTLRALLTIAIFTLLIGAGNIAVGSYKRQQYEVVARDLAGFRRTQADQITESALLRIKREVQKRENTEQRLQKASSRVELYSLVEFGGRLFLALSFICFFLTGGIKILIISKNKA